MLNTRYHRVLSRMEELVYKVSPIFGLILAISFSLLVAFIILLLIAHPFKVILLSSALYVGIWCGWVVGRKRSGYGW